jgi:glycosyltransferase involved in cell wall biosynthesis
MRIAHVITKGDVGGAQTHVLELATAQQIASDSVLVVAGSAGTAVRRARARGIDVVVIPSIDSGSSGPWRMWGRGAFGALASALEEFEADVVHAHSSAAGLLARLVARRHRVPSVYTAHGWPFQRGAPTLQRVFSFAGELVGGHVGDAVICLTPEERHRAERAHVVRRRRVWVIANGLADVRAECRWSSHDGPVGLVMVARFAAPKLQDQVVAALTQLTDLPWTMTFVGDGPRRDAASRHAALALDGRVTFTGHRDDVPRILASNDIAILWSAYEGMPISVLEAMRAGLCCVASDLPGVRSLFGSPEAGAVASDVASLSTVLRGLIEDDAARRALGKRARARYEDAFSAGAMADATRRVYEAVRER